jgi:type IV secretory pathway VirB4 component
VHHVLDECWALLQSPSLAPVVIQLFRTARKRNACVWGLSQAVEDFTGTPDKPNEFGGAILTTTATKMIGRQKGNIDVLRHFVQPIYLSPVGGGGTDFRPCFNWLAERGIAPRC